MSEDKNSLEQAVEQALDAFVYAPIGLIFDGPALFPKLVEKGRNQVNVARMMGQMAVQMGQSEAEKRVKDAQEQVRDTLVGLGVVPTPKSTEKAPTPPTVTEESPSAPTPAPAKSATKKSATKKRASAKKATAKKPAKKRTTTKRAAAKKSAGRKTSVPAVDSLGIPGYDSLSASQVVSRLQGLSASDLDAVKAYESGTRGRKTVLTKIAQLQKG